MAEIIQGTPEWYEVRCGKATASKIQDIIAKTKSGTLSAGRKNYVALLVAERLTGTVEEGYRSDAMQHGNDTEAEAKAAYEFITDAELTEVGFVDHPMIQMSGASPDSLVDDDGLVEVKCPHTATHISFLLGKGIDKKYITQMQWQMACTGRKWCDFVSYDPRMPVNMRLHVERVPRDDGLIIELQGEVREFLAEVSQTIERLTSKFERKQAAE